MKSYIVYHIYFDKIKQQYVDLDINKRIVYYPMMLTDVEVDIQLIRKENWI